MPMEQAPKAEISEESLPNYTEIKIQTDINGNHIPIVRSDEDKGCLFFYDPPTLHEHLFVDSFKAAEDMLGRKPVEIAISKPAAPLAMGGFGDVEDLGDKYQIAIDVAGYSPSDISVKAVGDGELMVEGKRVGTSGGGAGVTSCFSKRVKLPGQVELDRVSSSLSAKGVLTISAPKSRPSSSPDTHRPHQQTVQSNYSNTVSKTSSSKDAFPDMMTDLDLEHRMKMGLGFDDGLTPAMPLPLMNGKGATQEMTEDETSFKITLNTQGYNPSDIAVKTVGEKDLLIEGKHVEDKGGKKSEKNFSRKFTLPQAVKQSTITSSLSKDGTLTIIAPKMNIDKGSNIQVFQSPSNSSRVTQSSEQKHFTTSNANNNTSSPFKTDTTMDKFFDPHFENVFNHRKVNTFNENARNEMNNNSFKSMINNDWMTEKRVPDFFGATPESKLTSNSMNMSDMVESEKDYQIKMNVATYEPKDIRVRAVSDRDLLIEGSHQAEGGERSFS